MHKMPNTTGTVEWLQVDTVDVIQQLIEHSNAARSTGSTGANADSSRSHSIMQFAIKRPSDAADPAKQVRSPAR